MTENATLNEIVEILCALFAAERSINIFIQTLIALIAEGAFDFNLNHVIKAI